MNKIKENKITIERLPEQAASFTLKTKPPALKSLF
jgi:hypothetical protein